MRDFIKMTKMIILAIWVLGLSSCALVPQHQERMKKALLFLQQKNPGSFSEPPGQQTWGKKSNICDWQFVECYKGEVVSLFFKNQPLSKMPKEVLADFPDLAILDLLSCPLRETPNVSQNPKLIRLDLTNTFVVQPPNVDQNPKLREFLLAGTSIQQSPNVSHNPDLLRLDLSDTQVMSFPNLTNNPKLIEFFAENTPAKQPPDISMNFALRTLMLGDKIDEEARLNLCKLAQGRQVQIDFLSRLPFQKFKFD